jgi:WhiB family redox-sensing transcriptional regulator
MTADWSVDPLPAREETREEWMDYAACLYVDPEAFFPEKGDSQTAPKRVCAGCDVRAQCLAYALEHNEQDGIWGGVSARQRRHMRLGRVA